MSSEDLDHAVRQLLAKGIVPEGEIIDVFSAAGLKQPDISILSDRFLAEVRGQRERLKYECRRKKFRHSQFIILPSNFASRLVQSREFAEMLKKTLNAYHNRAIATQEVARKG